MMLSKEFRKVLYAGCPGNCNGTTFAVNDGASRIGAALGHLHVKCDKCGSRWSVEIPELPQGALGLRNVPRPGGLRR